MTAHADISASQPSYEPHGTRRDFLLVAGTAFAAVGTAMALWPMIDQMNPDAATLAEASIEVDLAPVAVGQALTVLWRKKPIFIRHRTQQEIDQAKSVALETLRDREARNPALPENANATDANRTIKGHDAWIVLIGVCTHLGCVPGGQRSSESKGIYGGWLCACHGSVYDTSGRIRQGPAPRNLDLPPYKFLTDTRIQIG